MGCFVLHEMYEMEVMLIDIEVYGLDVEQVQE